MTKNPQPRYEPDEDGYDREIVGSWVKDKHRRLAAYIGISRSVRAKFTGPGNAGATFIDLYSGPGRLRIRDETEVLDGSPLVAWHEAVNSDARFTEVYVADANPRMSEAVHARLSKVGAPVHMETGPANETVEPITSKLNPYALHFCVS